MFAWIKSIAFYMIAISLLMGILPDGSCKKYIKFFMGLVLSLLLVSPIMKLFSLDHLMAANYGDMISEMWEEEQAFLEEQEQKLEEVSLEALIQQTIEPLGYCLNGFQYERSEAGEILELIVWVGTEENAFEVPEILVEQIWIPEITLEENKNHADIIETKEQSGTGLEALLAAVCGVEAERIYIQK